MTGIELKHRLAAIFAADAAGYSRLMAADERGTVAALDSARAVFRKHIEANQGRVVDMAGDSVLAVFDLATGAVSAALAIQTDLNTAAREVLQDRRMLFRIGVHTGEIIEKTDGTVYGDGVNVAARLQGLAEAGTICVSDAVRSYVRGKVAGEFEDLGAQAVKNIAEPVRAYCVRWRATSEATAGATANLIASSSQIDVSLPDKPSIAALPFTNMSGDPEQEYFADGVTEDILTELSRFHSLFVIARNSSFSYKGKSPDIRQVGKELGVRYVLEGSVRKSSNRIRVTAQLIDALTGSHIWAEKYDRMLEDVFAVQEELTQSIVKAIAPRIDEAELAHAMRKRPENLNAYEIAVRSRATLHLAWGRQDRAQLEKGINEARAALAIDPGCVLALSQLAFGLWISIFYGTSANKREDWKEGFDAVTKAMELDSSNCEIFFDRAMFMTLSSEHSQSDQVIQDCMHAHELNPNDFRTSWGLAWVEMLRGDYPQATDHVMQALRINPRDPSIWNCYTLLSLIRFLAKDYKVGLSWGLRAIAQAPQCSAHQEVAICYVGMGEIAKASEALKVARQRAPQFIEAALSGRSVLRRPEERQRYTVFLRVAAGLQEPSAADALR